MPIKRSFRVQSVSRRRPKPRRKSAHQSDSKQLSATADRWSEALEEALARLEAGAEDLGRNRQPLCQQLCDAAQADQATTPQRRRRAKESTEKAKSLRALERWVKRTATDLREAVLISVNWAAIYVGPPDGVPFIGELEGMQAWLTGELKKRRDMAETLAQWHRTATTQKPSARQWGPATLRAVHTIVRAACASIMVTNESRSVKPQQRAEYYAGLLCIKTRLLPAESLDDPTRIAEVVRKRLDRGESLRLADEHYRQQTVVTTRPDKRR